jgi:hypothetical protein
MHSEEKVKKIAYELYEKNGRREGRDLLDWLAAKQIIRFEQMLFQGMGREGVYLLEYKPQSEARPGPKAPVKPAPFRKRPPAGRSEAGRRGL